MNEHHSLIKSISLHLLPGLLVVVLYIFLAPILHHQGYPSLLALGIAALLGIVPLQLGHLFYKAYQLNGKISLKGIITPTQSMSGMQFAAWLVGSLIILILIGGISFAFESNIKTLFFGWLPDWYFYDINFKSYSKEALLITAWVRLAVDGFVLPITEELYFRGYLFHHLPEKIKNKWIMAALLFAVYHFWQPWNYLSLFLISLVLVVPVMKFNNVYLSIAIHMLANIIGTLLFFGQISQL
ncbi:MAG: CPBP family intramembrane metalloprotease [Saprospiraceae bacterium]|nr:CPBP family intramembrane metalloprotease [Saprospiraceae bacterium]